MKFIAATVAVLFVSVFAEAQQSFKFDFGNGRVKKGYTAVTPDSKFANEKGYGFTKESELIAVDRGGKSVNDDYITSAKPFYFSVNLPDGNYDVKIILGDKKGTSATTVRAECRRLFLENVKTKKGQFVAETFTVNVRDSLIRDEKGTIVKTVKLKPREYAYLHWDNFLTIEFNDSLPKVCAIEITPNKTATTIFLAGNSTVVDQDKEPWAAWGQMIPRFFAPGKVAVANYAESGEALKSFLSARRLEKILSLMKPGDYLFIEFGHNDMKQKGPGIGPFTSYKKLLKQYIAEVKKKAGIPVLVTSMHRRNFDKDGKIVNTLLEYPDAVRQTAKEENVAIVDLNAMSKVLYEAWGPTKSIKAFVHFPANTFPGQTTKLEDNTHFSTYGACQLASCIVKSIKDQNLPLAQLLRADIPAFDPAKPSSFENFYWPLSSFMTSTKPDGN